jgi:hypothetical protein
MMKIDHVFICVDDPPAAERALADFGVQFGRRAVHVGQGTANACAMFDDAYLELLWRHDDRELASEVVRPLGLGERMRWRETGASPFGVALRPGEEGIPVETWPYFAPYLPAGAHLPIVTPPHAWREPEVFFMTLPLPSPLPPERRPVAHRGAHRRVTRVTVSGPRLSSCSPGLAALAGLGVFAVSEAAAHLLELEWDGGRSGDVHDFRPTLPLLLRS